MPPASYPIPSPARCRATPEAASSPNALPPHSTTACARSTSVPGRQRSVSRVPGAAPRTATPATAPARQTTAVHPVTASVSVSWPTSMPGTSVIASCMRADLVAAGPSPEQAVSGRSSRSGRARRPPPPTASAGTRDLVGRAVVAQPAGRVRPIATYANARPAAGRQEVRPPRRGEDAVDVQAHRPLRGRAHESYVATTWSSARAERGGRARPQDLRGRGRAGRAARPRWKPASRPPPLPRTGGGAPRDVREPALGNVAGGLPQSPLEWATASTATPPLPASRCLRLRLRLSLRLAI